MMTRQDQLDAAECERRYREERHLARPFSPRFPPRPPGTVATGAAPDGGENGFTCTSATFWYGTIAGTWRGWKVVEGGR